jgi:long-chain fatty acid transport protein
MTLIRFVFFISLTLLLSLVANTGFAANGSSLIGVSPSSRGMGGTAIGGGGHLTESFFKNPAALSSVKFGDKPLASEFGFTYLQLNTTADLGGGAVAQTGKNAVPTVGLAYSMGDLTVGLGLFGFAGVSVDFGTNPLVSGIGTAYRVIRLGGAASYQINPSLSLGIEPFLTYSDLMVQTATQRGRSAHGGLGAGLQVGLLGKLTEGLSGGINFTTGSRVKHDDIIDVEALSGLSIDGSLDAFTITVPWEIGAGLNYQATEAWTLALDYRFIGYNSSAGYQDVDWQNIHVIALGSEYKWGAWAYRAGVNYSPSPIENTTGESGLVTLQGKTAAKAVQSSLNIAAFPAFTQANLTVGTGYTLSEDLNLDFAFLYAPKVTRTRSGGTYTYTGTASQWAVSAGVRYRM